ncbi:MAG: arginine deiminase family protein [Euryarchaeota archaeon]|nr:arginine deiminase family protein [Euryarchaeota archaeon]
MGSALYKKAIVRRPGYSVVHGITTANLGKPNYEKALTQHEKYIETLESCGLEVTVMPAKEKFPDSTFVEDSAVLTEKCAVITNFGAESRRGEEESMYKLLKEFYNKIECIKEPGTLEGGDIMRVEDHFYIGLSERTNKAGARQLRGILAKYGYTSSYVLCEQVLHLKTGVAYLGGNTLVVTGEFIDKEEFEGFDKIIITEEESYAANSVRVNDYVIMPKGYEKSRNEIVEAGYKVKEVNLSEFRKIDGGVSCLSLRF